jgi:hypothetical protein
MKEGVMAKCESREDCKVRRYRVHPDKNIEIHPDTPIAGLTPKRGEREKGDGKGKITETYVPGETTPRGTQIKRDNDVAAAKEKVTELAKIQIADLKAHLTPVCPDGCVCFIPTKYADIRWPRDAFTYPKERRTIEFERQIRVSGKDWTFYYCVDVFVIKQDVVLTGRCIDPTKYVLTADVENEGRDGK